MNDLSIARLILFIYCLCCFTNIDAQEEIPLSSFIIEDIGKEYHYKEANLLPGLYCHVPDEEVCHGNTSIRNEHRDGLVWKGSPNSNGYGYFQRNRDLGQVFNVPPNQEEIALEALVFRSSLGSKAIMEGVSGSKLTIVFYEVDTIPDEELKINSNGTFKGDLASHGFDTQFNRCDDFITGATYRPIHVSHGTALPEITPTTLPGHPVAGNAPHSIQAGHLRFFRSSFAKDAGIVFKPGRRYAFIIGFTEPGPNRGMALAIKTEVHTKEDAQFIRDENGLIIWGIRREGDGTLPPTMMPDASPPKDSKAYENLVSESLFAEDHFTKLDPTSDGFPDVDTYRTLQYYLEIRKD